MSQIFAVLCLFISFSASAHNLRVLKASVDQAFREEQRAAQALIESPEEGRREAAMTWAKAAGVRIAHLMELYESTLEEKGEGAELGEVGESLRVAVGLLRAMNIPGTAARVFTSDGKSLHVRRTNGVLNATAATLGFGAAFMLSSLWAAQDPGALSFGVMGGTLIASLATPFVAIGKFIHRARRIAPELTQLQEELTAAVLEGIESTEYPYARPQGVTALQAYHELQQHVVAITAQSCAARLAALSR